MLTNMTQASEASLEAFAALVKTSVDNNDDDAGILQELAGVLGTDLRAHSSAYSEPMLSKTFYYRVFSNPPQEWMMRRRKSPGLWPKRQGWAPCSSCASQEVFG